MNSPPRPRTVRGWVTRMLVVATIFSVYVVVQSLVTDGRSLRAHGISLPGIIAFYYLGGLFVGVAVGLINPYLKTRAAGALAGFFIALPIATACYLFLLPIQMNLRQLIAADLGVALTLGVAYGFIAWDP